MNSTLKMFIVGLVCILGGCAEPARKLGPQEANEQESHVRTFLTIAVQEMNSEAPNYLDRAEASLVLAYEVKPDDARVQDGFGCLEFRRNQLDRAVEYFKRAIALSPEYDRPYEHLALVAVARKDWKVAAELYSVALEINPLNHRARNNYAVLLQEHGDRELALNEIRKAYINSGGKEDIVNANLSFMEQGFSSEVEK